MLSSRKLKLEPEILDLFKPELSCTIIIIDIIAIASKYKDKKKVAAHE